MPEEQRTLIKNTLQKVGNEVTLYGWIWHKREHGKLVFIDLKDRTGIVQCIADKDNAKKLAEIPLYSVIKLTGIVQKRPEKLVNKNIETGSVEIYIKDIELLNKSKSMPIPIDSDGKDIEEDKRLRYRYLDLRRDRMQKNIRVRNKVVQALRQELLKKDFIEIETPILSKSTKEGARDFIVPSRLQPGKFYALPQSPQQYKQLLMVAGFERYFQFAKCLRDEDLRADRQFEFTQLDLELSFVEKPEDVMQVVEGALVSALKSAGIKLREGAFPRINYQDAIKKYGVDKFDIRTEQEKKDGVLAFAWVVNFPFFKKVDPDDAVEVEDSKSGWTFTHNPFSAPIKEHLQWHLQGKNIDKIIAAQYDLVCCGYEIGGGSIRAHRPEVLRATYKIMGYSDKEIMDSIGHMIEAFEYGAPPHGGIALGLDRLIMLITGENSIKETIAFPTTASGKTSVMDAPSYVEDSKLKELGLKLLRK